MSVGTADPAEDRLLAPRHLQAPASNCIGYFPFIVKSRIFPLLNLSNREARGIRVGWALGIILFDLLVL